MTKITQNIGAERILAGLMVRECELRIEELESRLLTASGKERVAIKRELAERRSIREQFVRIFYAPCYF